MPVDAEQLRGNATYSATLPLAQIAADLDEIGRVVESWRAHRRRLNRLAFLLLPAGAVLIVLAIAADLRFLIGLAIPMFFAAFGLFIYAAMYARDCCKRSLRLQLARDLVAMVKDDADREKPASLELSFKERAQVLSEEPWPVRKKGTQKFLSDRWADFEAELLDDSKLHQEIADLVRERRYVNPRGKGKVKKRIRHLVAMRLKYPSDVYGDASTLPAKLLGGVRVPPLVRLRGCAISDRDIKLKAEVEKREHLKPACTMLALSAYRILNYARAAHGGRVS